MRTPTKQIKGVKPGECWGMYQHRTGWLGQVSYTPCHMPYGHLGPCGPRQSCDVVIDGVLSTVTV